MSVTVNSKTSNQKLLVMLNGNKGKNPPTSCRKIARLRQDIHLQLCCVFPHFLQSKYLIKSQITLRPLPSIFLSVHYLRAFFSSSSFFMWRNTPHRAKAASFWSFQIFHTLTITHTHIHTVGLLWTRDQLFAMTVTCTTQNKQEMTILFRRGIRTHDPSHQAVADYVLDPAAPGIGNYPINLMWFWPCIVLNMWK